MPGRGRSWGGPPGRHHAGKKGAKAWGRAAFRLVRRAQRQGEENVDVTGHVGAPAVGAPAAGPQQAKYKWCGYAVVL